MVSPVKRLKTGHCSEQHYGVIMLFSNTGSSAIAKINFDESNEVGVTFTSTDTEYKFLARDRDLVQNAVQSTINRKESLGSLIADYRKSGQLTQV
tara:strand:+ start:144 stop:428 length:285 start_codon:yes stop_codon:yes gene_type:complete